MPTRALTQEEERRLIKVIRGRRNSERDLVLIRLPLETGLRLSEAAGLNWQDLTSLHGELLPRFQLRKEIAKRGKSRTVELNRHIRAELENYNRWYSRLHGQTDGPLFISRQKGRLSPRQMERRADYWLDQAGIKGVSYHGLRHTFGVKVYQRAGMEHARRLLGHESISTTQIYVDHLNQDQLEQAVDW